MKCFTFFVLTFGITCAFIVPSEIMKQLSSRVVDRIIVEPANITNTTDVEKIKDRSTNSENLKDAGNVINDLVIQDVTPKASNVDQRSFLYLKQKHRTPIINVVHGSPDMLGKSNLQPIEAVNKAYLQDFTQKNTQRYIENYLRGYTYLKPSWQLNHKKSTNDPPRNEARNNYAAKVVVEYQANDHREEDDSDPDNNLDEKNKFVEFLKPPPLVRCDHRKGKHRDIIRDVPPHTTIRNSVGLFENTIYPLIPTRSHRNPYITPNYSYGATICDNKNPLKDSLCAHVYNSHIEDCVRKLLGKNDENAVRFLSKCVRNI